jgi:hypothetical protein
MHLSTSSPNLLDRRVNNCYCMRDMKLQRISRSPFKPASHQHTGRREAVVVGASLGSQLVDMIVGPLNNMKKALASAQAGEYDEAKISSMIDSSIADNPVSRHCLTISVTVHHASRPHHPPSTTASTNAGAVRLPPIWCGCRAGCCFQLERLSLL